MHRTRLPQAMTVALLLAVCGRVAAQTPPTAAQKAEVAARISSAELDTASSVPNAALFPAPRKFNHNHKIAAVFDRFKNRTNVTAEVMPHGLFKFSTSPFGMDAVFGFKGKELTAPPRYVMLGFVTETPFNWGYLKDHSVNLLVDDTLTIDAGETLWDGEIREGGPTNGAMKATEFIAAMVPLDQFLQLVNGKKVEVRVGTTAAKFKEDQLEVLRDLASRLMPMRKAP